MEKEKLDNFVYIGKKATMSYVYSVQIQSQKYQEIKIKARGRAISQAADVSQIAINGFLTGWKIKEINLSTEERKSKHPDSTTDDRVSVIEIVIAK